MLLRSEFFTREISFLPCPFFCSFNHSTCVHSHTMAEKIRDPSADSFMTKTGFLLSWASRDLLGDGEGEREGERKNNNKKLFNFLILNTHR